MSSLSLRLSLCSLSPASVSVCLSVRLSVRLSVSVSLARLRIVRYSAPGRSCGTRESAHSRFGTATNGVQAMRTNPLLLLLAVVVGSGCARGRDRTACPFATGGCRRQPGRRHDGRRPCVRVGTRRGTGRNVGFALLPGTRERNRNLLVSGDLMVQQGRCRGAAAWMHPRRR